jgi:hypothetical protein
MMIVRQTGARRHEHPYWYIYADLPEEQAAIRAGLLDDRAPDARWRFVIEFGRSKPAAVQAMEQEWAPKVLENLVGKSETS